MYLGRKCSLYAEEKQTTSLLLDGSRLHVRVKAVIREDHVAKRRVAMRDIAESMRNDDQVRWKLYVTKSEKRII